MKPPGDENIFVRFEALRNSLKGIIFDQEEAVDEVVDAFIHMTYQPVENPPRSIMTFFGPPAVGKTYLATSLTSYLDEYSEVRLFDMEQYSDPESAGLLIGQRLRIESGPDGELTEFIRNHPKSIILFDAIEKADNLLQLALLNLLISPESDSGIDCSGVIVIFTSNLGAALYQDQEFLGDLKENRARAQAQVMEAVSRERKVVYEAVQNAIAPKLLAAMARNFVILFNRLSLTSMVRIGMECLGNYSNHFTEKSAVALKYEEFEKIVTLLTLSFAPVINIKQVKKKLPDLFLGRVTRFISEQHKYPDEVVCRLSKRAANFLAKLEPERELLLQNLFKRNETVELSWKESWRAKRLVCTINRAERKRLPPVRDFQHERQPTVEFSQLGFNDIAGNRTTKKKLKQIITILQRPELVKKFAIDMPKGMLMYGPTGVGKTMFGKAFAREAQRPYIYLTRSDLFDPDYIRRAYQKAREFAPSIVFLDGVDIKGLIEGVYTTMPDEQLLFELDALSADLPDCVFTIATALQRDDVSPRLIAPGRIDTFIEVPELDREARRFFITKILEKPNDGKIDVEKVVRYITGMSGRDLQRIGKEAALYVIRNGLDLITEEILIEQINIIKYGYKLEKKHIRNLEEDLKITAYHEAGHAVLSHLLLPDVKVEQVTIAPRLKTLGFVSYTMEEFPGNVSREEIFNNICVLLAGRLASVKQFGSPGVDTGAANDLEAATQQAYTAIASLGMDEEIGFVHAETLIRNVNPELFSAAVEARVGQWLKEAGIKTESLIEQHWAKVKRLAVILIRQEIVDGVELEKVLQDD
ncbi:MAG: AAA family ATPase [Deltaproteobacteria bacterium]|nr:AAA family ATPase [Candidatus Tharpella sp.]